MSRVTTDTKQATRTRLLAAAAQEFARAGLERANVDAISLAAGYAKGTIYNYFASKEDLFLAVVEQASRQAAAASAAPAGAPARDRLAAASSVTTSRRGSWPWRWPGWRTWRWPGTGPPGAPALHWRTFRSWCSRCCSARDPPAAICDPSVPRTRGGARRPACRPVPRRNDHQPLRADPAGHSRAARKLRHQARRCRPLGAPARSA